MPIKIPENLPARAILEREGVMVMGEKTAVHQDIRPLQIALLNLMPNKIRTETQFARLIGATPLQIQLSLLRMTDHVAKNTSEDHLLSFYETWEEAKDKKFDGLIITGAPVELLPFEEVTYWRELQNIFDWTQTNIHSTLAVCWGAQAMAHHFHGVPKYTLDEKAFGIFRHRAKSDASPYLRGFSDDIAIPVSRWTEVRPEDFNAQSGVDVLIESDQTGLCLMEDRKHNALYMFNHIEYDTQSLQEEYERDLNTEKPVEPPKNYFPDDNPQKQPRNRWRSHAHLLFGNWINEVYQTTHFDLNRIRVNS
jgi:homoserine O-succinyltransferase/O-acetyltransferase